MNTPENKYCKSCNNCKYCNYSENCNNCDNCNFSDNCDNCDNCNNCKNCDNCKNCNYLENCNNCNCCNSSENSENCKNCDNCENCNNCENCENCESCSYSRNILMSELQIFCHSETFGGVDSTRQKPFRIFNVEISKKKYFLIKIPKIKVIFKENENYQTAFVKAWQSLGDNEKSEFTSLPHFNSDIFFKITGVEVK